MIPILEEEFLSCYCYARIKRLFSGYSRDWSCTSTGLVISLIPQFSVCESQHSTRKKKAVNSVHNSTASSKATAGSLCACLGMPSSFSHVQPFFNPMDYSQPGSSIHGTSQARILSWDVISSSRGSSQPSDWIQVSCTAGRFFTVWATGETHWRP